MANSSKEIWKQIPSLKGKTKRNYAVSNHGRLASFDKDIRERFVLRSHLNGGFPLISINREGSSKALFIHHAVAETFLKKRQAKCRYVIHLDHNKANNVVSNLKWVTKAEQVAHNKKSPMVLEAIARKVHTGASAKKLNEKKVSQLKKDLWDPKRKLTFKKLAEKYGISEMSLYRIKNGELWFHVHVKGEPLFAKYKEQLKNIEFKNRKEARATAQKVKENSIKANTTDTKKNEEKATNIFKLKDLKTKKDKKGGKTKSDKALKKGKKNKKNKKHKKGKKK